ncbi:hypothetical protein MPSEU_000599100 [Mayamaea pseudoterrestris]|nr:hypothetical protein MPSEU_000599100 [Mayamaea pseudoterrestris]
MRLFTHNFLQSTVKGTTKGYPLGIEATEVTIEESPVDREMLRRTLPKLDYPTLRQASIQLANQIPDMPELPQECPQLEGDDDELLFKNLHKVLFDIHVIEGTLICPDTGRRFPIKDSIPNMILHEDEL